MVDANMDVRIKGGWWRRELQGIGELLVPAIGSRCMRGFLHRGWQLGPALKYAYKKKIVSHQAALLVHHLFLPCYCSVRNTLSCVCVPSVPPSSPPFSRRDVTAPSPNPYLCDLEHVPTTPSVLLRQRRTMPGRFLHHRERRGHDPYRRVHPALLRGQWGCCRQRHWPVRCNTYTHSLSYAYPDTTCIKNYAVKLPIHPSCYRLLTMSTFLHRLYTYTHRCCLGENTKSHSLHGGEACLRVHCRLR